MLRHPKYKTEVCRTFAQNGTCPYGTRCRFIHQRAPTKSVLGTLIAAAHVVVPSDWRPEGKPGAGAGGGSGSGRRDSAEDTPRRLPIFQHIAADEEEEDDEEAKEADRLIAETRKRIPEPRFVTGGETTGDGPRADSVRHLGSMNRRRYERRYDTYVYHHRE